ncbi:hypothetical protein [Nakamurella sp.]|uniref:hypothetical protein n=1 Tax=Nakamurella sp. TaxID=1869182 RepID=UPI003783E9CF
MGIKHDDIEFESPRTVQDIGRRLQESLAGIKASSVEHLESAAGALAQFDDRADIEVIARGVDFSSLWAVQVYVEDRGARRAVRLVALGDGSFTRTMSGRNSTSLAKSIKKRDVIARSLR